MSRAPSDGIGRPPRASWSEGGRNPTPTQSLLRAAVIVGALILLLGAAGLVTRCL